MKIILTYLFLSIFINTNAQSHIDASGNNINGSGGTISYSIGQIDYITENGYGGLITEGVQQPYETFKIETVINKEIINLNIIIFPNPTFDFIKLRIDNITYSLLDYELLDITGKFIYEEPIIENISNINVLPLKSGMYILNITNLGKIIKTFKIIKN